MNFEGELVKWPEGVDTEHDIPRFDIDLSVIARTQGLTFWIRVPAEAREKGVVAARDLCASVCGIDFGREVPSADEQKLVCTVQLLLFSIRNQVETETGDFMPPRRASGMCAARPTMAGPG